MQITQVIEDVLNRPPVNFAPERQSLKAWAMYCLRDRGFKVIYAQNADFAIETKAGEKLYFKVTESAEDPGQTVGWIVRDRDTNQIRVIAAQSNSTDQSK